MLPEDALSQLENEIPCRTAELKQLDVLFQLSTDISSSCVIRTPAVVVYGPSQTGKTSSIRALIEASDEHDCTYIECRKCCTSRALFEYTIDELCQLETRVDEDGVVMQDTVTIDSLESFLTHVERILSAIESSSSRLLIFDHISSTLFEDYSNIIESVADLFTNLDAAHSVVFVVNRYEDLPQFPITTIHFPVYSASELCTILEKTGRPELDYRDFSMKSEQEYQELWKRFCKWFLSLFYHLVGHDLELYRTIAGQLLPKYMEPLKDGRLSVTKHVQLGRTVLEQLIIEDCILAEDAILQHNAKDYKTLAGDLSVCARYLVIAAFLASYNPGKTDRVYFSRGRGEKTKKQVKKRAVNRVTRQPQKVLGPKGFTLDRMLSIFQAIVPNPYEHTALLDQQIALIFALKLVTKISNPGDLLDDGKWVVNVDLETVLKISESIKFDMNRFFVSD